MLTLRTHVVVAVRIVRRPASASSTLESSRDPVRSAATVHRPCTPDHGACALCVLYACLPQQLFKVQLMKEGEVWEASSGKNLAREIPDFSVSGNNTVVIRAHMTKQFSTFMLSLTPDGRVRTAV